MFPRRRIVAIVVLLVALPAGLAVAFGFRSHRIHTQLRQVESDWKALTNAMAGLGADNCGIYLPSDTTWRSQERPTFETLRLIHPRAPRTGVGNRGSRSLTTPVAYVARYPEDPFCPGRGYGFVMWSFFDKEPPIAFLHSPGPDGDVDLSLTKVYYVIQSLLPNPRPDKWPNTYPAAIDAYAKALADRFAYDPTNGLRSDGDLVQFYSVCGPTDHYGFPSKHWSLGSPSALSIAEIDALLGKYPDGLRIPLSRWEEDQDTCVVSDGMENLFPVGRSFYHAFAEYLSSDTKRSDAALEGLSGRMGEFARFFTKPGPLNAEQCAALEQWERENPEWWKRVKENPVSWVRIKGSTEAQRSERAQVYTDATRYAQFYVFYAKSRLLMAARLCAGRDHDRAYWILNDLVGSADSLKSGLWIAPPSPIVERAGSEIYRMSHDLSAQVSRNPRKRNPRRAEDRAVRSPQASLDFPPR